MNQLDSSIKTKLLFESKERFSSNADNTVLQIDNEPYSFRISKTKMYVFDQDDLIDFLAWYWFNEKESFLVDLSDIDHKTQWKYFCDNNPGFIHLYPNPDSFTTNVYENVNLVNIYDNLVMVNGINHFINHVVLNKYKRMGIKKLNNIYYKFATNCGRQILF